MNWQVTTAPTTEPVTLAEAKTHLRVDGSDEDTFIEGLIQAAREWCEDYERRAYITRTITAKFDRFYSTIILPMPKIQSVTSVKYLDTAGTEQTLSTDYYDVDTYREPGAITLAYNKTWPTTRDINNAVEVVFVAGYGDADDVPERVKCAIKLLIGHLYENRETTSPINISEVPLGIKSLLTNRSWTA